jgi:putative glycosyltransferase (TIGR04372 family)
MMHVPLWKSCLNRLLLDKNPQQAVMLAEKVIKAKSEEISEVVQFVDDLVKQHRIFDANLILSIVEPYHQNYEICFLRGSILEAIYSCNPFAEGSPSLYRQAQNNLLKALEYNPLDLTLYVRLLGMLMGNGRIVEARQVIAAYLEARKFTAQELGIKGLSFRIISCIPNGIGHITLLDYHTKMRRLGLISNQPVYLILETTKGVNRAYLDYWVDHGYHIIDHPEAIKTLKPLALYYEDHFNIFSFYNGEVHLSYHAIADVEARWQAAGFGPLLTLKKEHVERGWALLEKVGMQRTDWFVTLHARESSYTGESAKSVNDHRNSDIESFILAIKKITQAGGWVIRMGDPKMKPLPPLEQVFDYAISPERYDWMDVFLCAENRFYLGVSSGPCMIPPCFGKLCALANYDLLTTRPFYFGHLFMPKLHRDIKQNRLRTFREMLQAPTRYCYFKNFFTEDGVEFVNNTADEIEGMTTEMLKATSGVGITYTPEQNERQIHLNKLGHSLDRHFGTNGRMAGYFLEKHTSLLR